MELDVDLPMIIAGFIGLLGFLYSVWIIPRWEIAWPSEKNRLYYITGVGLCFFIWSVIL